MRKFSSHCPDKLELLAPAGTLDVFASAVEHGADAVYIGAPALNARALAKHFSYEEMAAMIEYGHSHGIKIYVAMNSLLKEEEIPQALEVLTVLSALKPDALIIQDLGLYSIITKYFPSLAVHASTLMAAHNSQAVRHFMDMGFKRVVLAREMTISEIAEIHKQCNVELEVFVHGALCFSYSGLCLFSSFQGGKSGLRGRCVQPCRRRYTWRGKGRGPNSGYLFSMNDLEAVDVIPDIKAAGITSIKIEGRMRSASYVGAVVKAYRMVIDAADQLEDVLPEARNILAQAMGRKTTAGYFLNSPTDDILSPKHSGNIGVFLGKVKSIRKDTATLLLRGSVQTGDRIRLHHEKSGERLSFTLNYISKGKKSLSRGESGETVSLLLPGCKAVQGDSIYKVDTRQRRKSAHHQKKINLRKFQKQVNKALNDKRIAKVTAQLGLQAVSDQKRIPEKSKKKRKFIGKKIPPIWLKTDDLRTCLLRLPYNVERKLLILDTKTYSQFMKMKKPARHLFSSLIWGLPPVILEDMLQFYRQAVTELIRKGFRFWQVSHISQLDLFPSSESTVLLDRKKERRRIMLGAEYSLNVMNTPAFQYLKEKGMQWVQVSIESDQKALLQVIRNKKTMNVGMTVYGRPPLFTARLTPDFFRYGQTFYSPRGERFELQKRWGQTVALAEKPFSLLPLLSEQPLADLDYAVIDLTGRHYGTKELSYLFQQIEGKGKKVKQPSLFNYGGSLQ